MDSDITASTMPCVTYDRIGQGSDFVLSERPIPEVDDNQVLFKVAAFALNQADLLLTQGQHYVRAELPIRLGYEGCGTVIKTGKAVRRFKVGDRVSCIPNIDGPYTTAAAYALAHEEFLGEWPAAYSAAQAAAIWMQYLTPYYPLAELFPVKSGDWVLITAASGGTGMGTIKMARLLGARIIATTRNPHNKASFLKDQGAEYVITSGDDMSVEQVHKITQGNGVQLICDSIGGRQLTLLTKMLSSQGVLYVHGGLSGDTELRFPVLDLVRSGAGLYGYSLINELRKPGALQRGREFISEALASGMLPAPVIDRVFPFEEAAQAYAYMSSGAQCGKIVVCL